jgi:hypothetical protein
MHRAHGSLLPNCTTTVREPLVAGEATPGEWGRKKKRAVYPLEPARSQAGLAPLTKSGPPLGKLVGWCE